MSETEYSGNPEGGGPPPGPPPESRPPEGAESASPAAPPRPAARKPKIGDTRPAPAVPPPKPVATAAPVVPLVRPDPSAPKEGGTDVTEPAEPAPEEAETAESGERRPRARRRSGRERRSRQVGRYLVCVHVQPHMTQIAMLEGRSLVEHYVSRAADDTNQIDGNVYRGRVQNVLPGMEAAFVDIGIPKNAVLYRGDVRYDKEDIEGGASQQPRIEDVLKAGQTILCQVTKNPIGAKGARLTQEVSLPGRFAVLVPNSSAFGISKRLGDNERRRLRRVIDEVKPAGHGMIVRTAAEGVSAEELQRDVTTLVEQWNAIEAEAKKSNAPGLLYREPDLAVRILREELNAEYRGVVIDDRALYEQVRDYVTAVSPELAERVEYYDTEAEGLPIFERYHVHEQLHKALDRKVWLPSGGSLIIERTEALTVIDVNTGKNVGKTNLEETVFATTSRRPRRWRASCACATSAASSSSTSSTWRSGRTATRWPSALRNALSRDKTRTQVFDISELGLVEMTRKRVSEGLLETLSTECTVCGGRGVTLDDSVLG